MGVVVESQPQHHRSRHHHHLQSRHHHLQHQNHLQSPNLLLNPAPNRVVAEIGGMMARLVTLARGMSSANLSLAKEASVPRTTGTTGTTTGHKLKRQPPKP